MTNIETSALTNLTASDKIDCLLSQEKITFNDINVLSTAERQQLGEKATEILKHLTGKERDEFLYKIAPILPVDMKTDVWEHNHVRISNAISNLLRRQGFMPTKNAIAQETGLSRQTVAKHLKEYRSQPEFAAEIEQFKFMSHRILANVFNFASNGDVKAARLYFEMIGAINKQHTGTVVNKHNNYLQINNTILSQENLKQLTTEQLNQIEKIVTNKEYKIL